MKGLVLIVAFGLVAMSGVATSRGTAPEPRLKLEVIGPAKPIAAGEEIVLQVTISTDDEQNYEFLLAGFPQVFGIYLLGPWGPIQPNLAKVRPENWMHQQHSVAKQISIAKGKPYRTTVKLSDYFRTEEAEQFKPGVYQVNVKFYAIDLKLAAPIDSGAVRFELLPKK
jgi:hypothetical protein